MASTLARLATSLLLLTGIASPALAVPIYPEVGGQVVMEAENFSARSAAADLPDGLSSDTAPDQWLIVPDEFAGTGFANARGGFLQVSDSDGIDGEGNFSDPTGNGPFVDYAIQISTADDYELFARWDSPGTQNNSFYAMLLDSSNALVGSVFTFNGGATNNIDSDFATDPWDDVNAIFTGLAAGDYTLRLSPREDGVAVDTLVFQSTSLAAPTGVGPPATTPVPEPGLAALLLGGLAGLAVRRRSRGGA